MQKSAGPSGQARFIVSRATHFSGALAVLALCLASTAPSAFAHGGGLDASGCHTNRKTGDYHCHRSATTPAPSRESGVVKKSKSGICHDPSSQWYSQTIHYTAFNSLQECLDSGGRLPKG